MAAAHIQRLLDPDSAAAICTCTNLVWPEL